MENFLVGKEAVAAAKRKRITHPPERIEKTVCLARHVGATAAALQLNRTLSAEEQVQVATIDTWLSRFRKEGNFWEKNTKRGRPAIIDCVPGVKEEWKKQVDALRSQAESVTGRVSCAIARGILEEKAPSVLHRHGGAVKLSLTTGQQLLARDDKTFRKKTSSKVIPPADTLAQARDQFYAKLRDCFPGQILDRHLVLNYDETFHAFKPTRGFTWEKKGAARVQVTDSKDGFTLLPVISVSGFIGAQMIFGGSTAASLPSIPPGPHLRYAQSKSHWSNGDTIIELFKTVIFPHIAARRAALGQPAAPAIVLADAFSAHWTPAVLALIEREDSVAYVAIPDSLTHLFQPLDLGVIAGMKQSIMRRLDDFMESEVRAAVREGRGVLVSKSRTVLRDRVTTYIKECCADPVLCAEHCCRVGFDRAGITRVLYAEDHVHADVDQYIPPSVCIECGELAIANDFPPGCECFDDDDSTTLCAGCFENHRTLCLPRA